MIPVRRIAAGASDIWVGQGLLDDAAARLSSRSGRWILISAAGPRAAADRLRRALSGRLIVDLEIDDREEAKRLAAVEGIADAALGAGVRRDDAIVAVGGGVVSDLAGFAAAILLRGVSWSAVPTTTGSMADAAIGGKTGVDHPLGKNLLGAFHPPDAVLIDPAALEGLPERDYRAGLVEAFKAAWIADGALSAQAGKDLSGILARRIDPLLALLEGAASVKAGIVSEDPREGDRRRLLNFGHTLGHAFEAEQEYRGLRHGEAVAWGIAAALELSQDRAGLSSADGEAIRVVLSRLGPFPRPEVDGARLEAFLSRDKKATAKGLPGVLLDRIGSSRIEEAIPAAAWVDAARRMRIEPARADGETPI